MAPGTLSEELKKERALSYSRVPLRIAQISDLHAGEVTFQHDVMARAIETINRMHPDVVVVAGDLTTPGYEDEYIEAAGIVAQNDPPQRILPVNHHTPTAVWVHFDRYFDTLSSRH